MSSPTAAIPTLISLNSGPLEPLNSGGTLSISESSLLMHISFQGTILDTHATWFSTDPLSPTPPTANEPLSSVGSRERRLDEAAAEVVRGRVSPQVDDRGLSETLRVLRSALGW